MAYWEGKFRPLSLFLRASGGHDRRDRSRTIALKLSGVSLPPKESARS
jgi:hypothetical protein